MEEQLHDLLQPWKNSTRQITSVAYHAHITIYMEGEPRTVRNGTKDI